MKRLSRYNAEKVGVQTVQQMTIFKTALELTIPERESIPETDVRLKNEE
jgi:hypothetical protein